MDEAAPEVVVGIDFAGPAQAARQRRKILVVAATRYAARAYRVTASGLNERLLGAPPGWTAAELADGILSSEVPVSVVAPDFPFSLPRTLLESDDFAARVGAPAAFRTWEAFNAAVRAALPLSCPVDYSAFQAWKDPAFRLKRACDVTCGAQPPLKYKFQVLFNMTLLGAAFLGRLESSGRFDVVPFQARGRTPVIEIYPGHTMRSLGVPGYKGSPRPAIEATLEHVRGLGFKFEVDPAIRAVCETYDSGRRGATDHDAADALVAATVAALHREGDATPFDGGEGCRHEGTIWSVRGRSKGLVPRAEGRGALGGG